MGVRFDPIELRLALVEADRGRIGALTERLALLCAHLDPRLGRHSAAVLAAVQWLGLGSLALLAVLLGWPPLRQALRERRDRRDRDDAPDGQAIPDAAADPLRWPP